MSDSMLYLAQLLGTADSLGIPTKSGGDAAARLTSIFGVIYLVTGIVAVIVIIIAGIQYAVSSGDAAKVTKAKNAIIYAVVGIVVVIMAYAITSFVAGRF